MESYLQEIEQLKQENKSLREDLEKTKGQLHRYLAPERHKVYYETNKETIKQKVKEYKEKTDYHNNVSQEKKKQYARTAYLNKKAKMQKMKDSETIV